MHRTIIAISRRFVHIRPGEGQKVLLTFLYFFLVITAYYVIKPVSRSLILGELGARFVPYIDLICAICMGPIVALFARFVDRIPKPRLVAYSFWTIIGVLGAFWWLVHWKASWMAGPFYVWVAIFSVLVVTLFWLVANDLYRPRDAKRLFGFIGSGGILGGMVGSSIAAVGAQVIGTEHLLLLSIGLLLLCWAVVERLWRFAPERLHHEEKAQAAHPKPHTDTYLTDVRSFMKLIMHSRYLRLLIGVVALNKIVATLVYYQLNPFIETTFPDNDAKTTFNGMFFGGINVVAFIVQFFFTSWILRRWGVGPALLILPATVLFGVTGLSIWPVFWVAAGTELWDASFNYSLQQTAKEVLYLPIDRTIRYKVKPFIDMVVFRFGKGIAAIIGILFLDMLHAPVRVLSLVTIPLLITWLVMAVVLARDYIATIRTMLQARAAAKRPAHKGASPERWAWESAEPFGSLTTGEPSPEKLLILERLVKTDGQISTVAKELLADLTDYETLFINPLELEREAARLKDIISDHGHTVARRRQAVRLLGRFQTQQTVDYLYAIVMLEGDAVLRHEAVRGLVRMRLAGVRMDLPIPSVQRMIAEEVDNYQQVHQLVGVYRKHHRGPVASDDPVIGMLRVLMAESIEQIFRLLMLIYRPEDIHLIYEQLREPETHIRADAVELLDNLIAPSMRTTLFPILDEDRYLALEDDAHHARTAHDPAAAYRVLQEAIWDHNCWLSVTALCAIARLHLSPLQPELEKAAKHKTPLIAMAAKVALHLYAQP